jgi:hypothetical protein
MAALPYAALLSSRFSSLSIAGSSSGPPSEAPSSEVSSVDSFSDLRTIAVSLGIMEPEEVYVERFKIDRAKLEEMLISKPLVNAFIDVGDLLLFIYS